MRNIALILTFILTTIISSFAQTNENSTCPTISVSGPAGVVEPNIKATFTVNVETKGKELNLEYIWSTSAGAILSGQNTPTLTVEQPAGNLTVTVEVKGLPDGCPNTDSETVGDVDLPPQAEKLEEFSGSFSQINKAGFKKIIAAVQNDQYAQLYICKKYKDDSSKIKIDKTSEKVKNYLLKAGIEADRIVFVDFPAKTVSLEFWLVPVGATPPSPK